VSISDVNCCIKLQIPDISSSRLRRDNLLFFSQTKSGLRMYECIPPIRRYSEFGEKTGPKMSMQSWTKDKISGNRNSICSIPQWLY